MVQGKESVVNQGGRLFAIVHLQLLCYHISGQKLIEHPILINEDLLSMTPALTWIETINFLKGPPRIWPTIKL